MRRILIAAAVGLALAACQDQSPDFARPAIQAQFATSQVAHFFFMPPLAPEPVRTGTFNPTLYPVVEICQLTSSNGSCMGPLIGTFTRTTGTGGQLVTVQQESRYQLDWQTSAFNLPNGTYVRITVRSAPGGGTVFGFLDVYLDTSSGVGGASGAVGAVNGSTVPVKFIMEDGILCQNDSECFEGTIDSNGGTFTFPDHTAGVQAPAGAISQGQAGNLVIERYRGPDPCLPTDFPQYESCLRVHVEGNVTALNAPVEVGFCLEAGAPDVAELRAAKWDEVDPATLRTLNTVDVSDFITCSTFGQANQPRSQLARFAEATGRLLKPIASLFGATPAYAASTMGPGPIPFGAGMSDFSRIGVIRPLQLDKVAGDNTSAFAGLPVPIAAKVTSQLTGAPVEGVHVTFTPASGGGTVSSTDVLTDGAGLATTNWMMGPGAVSLVASAFNPETGFPNRTPPTVFARVTFNGKGLDYRTMKAVFLPPIGKKPANPAKYVKALPANVTICLLDANKACTTAYGPLAAADDGTKYEANWSVPGTLGIGETYRIIVSVGTLALKNYLIDLQVLAGGKAKNLTDGSIFDLQPGSNQAIRFTIENQ